MLADSAPHRFRGPRPRELMQIAELMVESEGFGFADTAHEAFCEYLSVGCNDRASPTYVAFATPLCAPAASGTPLGLARPAAGERQSWRRTSREQCVCGGSAGLSAECHVAPGPPGSDSACCSANAAALRLAAVTAAGPPPACAAA
jgi:hypothetical protein